MTDFQTGSLLLALLTVALIYKTYKADHERRKKQATVEAMQHLSEKFTPIYFKLDNELDGKPINKQNLKNKEKMSQDIISILFPLEYFSVGVNSGIYDKDLVIRMSGEYFVRIWNQLSPWIKERRVKVDNLYLYGEFETLCNTLSETAKKTKPKPIREGGDIK